MRNLYCAYCIRYRVTTRDRKPKWFLDYQPHARDPIPTSTETPVLIPPCGVPAEEMISHRFNSRLFDVSAQRRNLPYVRPAKERLSHLRYPNPAQVCGFKIKHPIINIRSP